MIAEAVEAAVAVAAAWLWEALRELVLALAAVLAVTWIEWTVRGAAANMRKRQAVQ